MFCVCFSVCSMTWSHLLSKRDTVTTERALTTTLSSSEPVVGALQENVEITWKL